METHVFDPWVTRCRTARQRLLLTFAPHLTAQRIGRCFDACVEECRRLGLTGNALLVAAEHMASTQLRAGVPAERGVLELA